ncbi:MAG: dihydroorotate dehydrogenase [Candidatus Margulisiibacteriota bacterium]|jgi:dihydroorotate dehydrogenase (NAD+) catalytic subunit
MIDIAGIKLKNRIMPASGTMAYSEVYAPYLDYAKLGALVTKAVTLEPRIGNVPPRLVEVENGIINSVGLQNSGLQYFLAEELPRLAKYAVPVIVNVAGATMEEYGEVVKLLNCADSVSAVELNISCPNVKEGCLAFGSDPEMTRKVVALARSKTTKPLIVKLSPNVQDITVIARAAVDAGADVLSLINTVKAEAKGLSGGLSGPAIKQTALRLLKQVRGAVSIPLIGIGGIASAEDVREFLACGASAVQIGTAALVRPWILEELAEQFGN